MTKQKAKHKNLSKKRDSIIDAALSAFLDLGYGDTTIDEIIKRAGGSKATVYRYFKNKEDLFATVVDKVVRHRPVEELDHDSAPEQALLKFAGMRLKIVFGKQHIALRRLVIGEATKFPNIARMYYSHGPELSQKQLAAYFQGQARLGRLSITDPQVAAEIFKSMLMHSLYLKSLFVSVSQIPTKQLNQHAKTVVHEFLQLYGV